MGPHSFQTSFQVGIYQVARRLRKGYARLVWGHLKILGCSEFSMRNEILSTLTTGPRSFPLVQATPHQSKLVRSSDLISSGPHASKFLPISLSYAPSVQAGEEFLFNFIRAPCVQVPSH